MSELYLILFFIFVIGISIGSFLNVLIYRVPKIIEEDEKLYAKELLGIKNVENESLDNIFRPSKCPKCSNKLKYRHNIPVFGWIFLKGQCYFCKQKISIEYPIVELLTGLIFVTIVYIYGLNVQSISLLMLTIFFIPLFMIDAKHQLLPDYLTLPLVWLGIILNSYGVFVDINDSVWGAIIGYMSLYSVFWLYKILTGKDGFGYGDFKLLAAVGAWFGYQMLLYTIFISCMFGIIIAIMINLLSKEKTNILPFGPSIILATIFYLITKDNLYICYNQLMMI